MAPLCFLLFLFLAVTTAVPTTLSADALATFYRRMAHNSKKIALIRRGNEYKWVAKEEIKQGEAILGVPLSACITTFDTFPLSEVVAEFKPDIVLTVRILYEKFVAVSGGFATDYIHSLSVNLTQIPLWPEEAQERINNEINYAMKVQMQSDMTNSYYIVRKKVKNALPDSALTWDAWSWAFITAQTKAFQLDRFTWLTAFGYTAEERDKAIYGGAMYPLIDLIPHLPLGRKMRKEGRMAVVMQGGKTPGPVVLADRDFHPRQEIVMHYRNMTNYELLYLHGRIVEKNADESFEVSTGNDPKCPGTVHGDSCWFQLGVDTVNFTLLNWLRLLNTESVIRATPSNIRSIYISPKLKETQAAFTGALVLYRLMVIDRVQRSSSVAIRTQRRALEFVNETYYQLAGKLGVSQKMVMYRHLTVTEREMMRLFVAALSL